jgi:hypothetical protein
MEMYEWLVFTCRACRRVIKLSPAMAGSHVVCPFCRTKVSVPKDAPVIKEAATHNEIPAARTGDDTMSQLRGPGREEWEVGNRPIGGELNFRDRLHSTSAPGFQRDAPGQPEVHRVNMRRRKHEQTHADFDDPDQVTRRRSGRRKLRSHGQAFGRTMVRGLVVCVILLAGAVGWLGWRQFKQPKPESSYNPPWVQRDANTLEPGGPKLETSSLAAYGPALRETIRRFVSAPTLDDMLQLVRERARVEPKIRAYYNKDNPWHPFEVRNTFQPDEPVKVDGNFISLQLCLANYEEVPIGLEHKDNTFLVDWECFTGYGEMSWDDLMAKRPEQPVLMRVVLEQSPNTDYFNGPFSDPSKYHCYLVRDLNSRHLISGYCPKDSPLDTLLRRHLRRLPPPSSMFSAFAVIRLRYPEKSAVPNQVEITEFLENGWIFRPDNK